MATGNIDPTFAGTQTRNEAGGVWGGPKLIPGQDDLPCQDFRRGTIVRNYQFDNEGGALGNINLGDALPDDLAIVGGWAEVTTPLVSGGGSQSIGVTGADAGILVDGTTLEAAGVDILAAALTTPVVVSNATTYVVLDVNTNVVTAGSVTVYLDVIKLNG